MLAGIGDSQHVDSSSQRGHRSSKIHFHILVLPGLLLWTLLAACDCFIMLWCHDAFLSRGKYAVEGGIHIKN
jgi:hypothetical protein